MYSIGRMAPFLSVVSPAVLGCTRWIDRSHVVTTTVDQLSPTCFALLCATDRGIYARCTHIVHVMLYGFQINP